MMLSIIAGLDALPFLAPPGAVAWRPLVGPCPPYPARRGPAARASVYVDARALSWHHGFEAEGLGYLKLSLGKGRKTFMNSSVVSTPLELGRMWLHAFQRGWHLGHSAGAVALSSHVLRLGPKVPNSALCCSYALVLPSTSVLCCALF